MFMVSMIGFTDMQDIVVLLDNILDIALWMKNPRWRHLP